MDFYKPYDRDPETYHCPNDDLSVVKENGCTWFYVYRNSLFLPDRLKLSDNKIKPAPESVLMYCQRHQVAGSPDLGVYIGLRENGAVSIASAGKIAYWTYRGGGWTRGSYPDGYPVFPNEPWPPQSEK